MVDDLTSPALTVGIRPTLLLPEDMAGDVLARPFQFALMHELTHYRRRDHLVMLLESILRGLWWFNPTVWLMDNPLRADMETACDASVTRGMTAEEKLQHANLLLEMGKEHRL